jgi:hypothetical protein
MPESTHLYTVAAVGVIAVSIVLFGRIRGRGALTASPKRVTFSDKQLTALRSLWHWYKTSSQPAVDPLSGLSTAQIADLVQKCGLVESAQSGLEKKEAVSIEKRALALGMNEMQSQILVGMLVRKLGPAHLGS